MTSTTHRQGLFECVSRRGPCDLTVFCLHHAGGSAAAFRQWYEYAPPDVRLCAIELPGRGRRIRERPLQRLADVVERLGADLLGQLHERYALFGHSMGALVAFELARWLRRRQQPMPEHLFLSGQGAPQTADVNRDTYALPDEELVAYVDRLNGTPLTILSDPDARAFFLPLLRADFEVVQTYRYYDEPPLGVPITAYAGRDDESAPAARVEQWRAHTSTAFEMRVFPGTHFFLNAEDGAFSRQFRGDLTRLVRGEAAAAVLPGPPRT